MADLTPLAREAIGLLVAMIVLFLSASAFAVIVQGVIEGLPA